MVQIVSFVIDETVCSLRFDAPQTGMEFYGQQIRVRRVVLTNNLVNNDHCVSPDRW